jgi:hypothetical protein
MRISSATSWLPLLILAIFVGFPADVRADPNCTCRYAGQSFALDTCVCITTSSGSKRACCGFVLNNTSWKFTDQACPIASAPITQSTKLARASRPNRAIKNNSF